MAFNGWKFFRGLNSGNESPKNAESINKWPSSDLVQNSENLRQMIINISDADSSDKNVGIFKNN